MNLEMIPAISPFILEALISSTGGSKEEGSGGRAQVLPDSSGDGLRSQGPDPKGAL